MVAGERGDEGEEEVESLGQADFSQVVIDMGSTIQTRIAL